MKIIYQNLKLSHFKENAKLQKYVDAACSANGQRESSTLSLEILMLLYY